MPRRYNNRTAKDPGSRVSILLNEPLNSTVRAIAVKKNRRLAPLLREWIEERVAKEKSRITRQLP